MVKLSGRKICAGGGACAALRARAYPFGKRILDVVLSAFLLLAATPLFFFAAFGIRVTSRGPVLFRQVRVGRRLEPFLLYKFRTMSCRAPHDLATADMPPCYLTRFGRFLRRTSLDELPQLWNVLRGDMSLLGPRPVVTTEVELIASRAAHGVYTVRPGISGLAQISGRDLLSLAEKVRLDSEYVRRMSFFQDARLLLSTFLAVFTRRDIREGHTP